MEENIKDKLSKILSGMGNNGKANTSGLSELLKSGQGKKLVESLSESDKKALLNKFMSLDTKDINEKLKNVDSSKLEGLSVDDIKKKLR